MESIISAILAGAVTLIGVLIANGKSQAVTDTKLEELTREVEQLLQRAGAAHLDFTPLGDALMFQCVFEAHRLYVYRKIALEIAALLPQGVRGRLLCLDKNFESMHVFWLRPGEWQEEERPVPEDPPSGLKTWRIAGSGPQDMDGEEPDA